MEKTAFLFPGQGAQVCGMGQDFYENFPTARAVFDMASDLLGFSMPELCFTPNDRLDITEYTQAAMVTTGIAIHKILSELGIHPDVTAGLSLGEYCALVAANAMTAADAIVTVRRRGILMQEAVPAGIGTMRAVLGMQPSEVNEVIASIEHVQVANYNCPGQIVISGLTHAVEEASLKLKEAGARRIVPLNVSGPFHSYLLQDAGKQLADYLEHIEISTPAIPYLANVTAQYVTSAEEIKPLLAQQVSSSVKWQQSMETMLSDGVSRFIEIGPGKTLCGFLKKTDRSAQVINIEKISDLEKLNL